MTRGNGGSKNIGWTAAEMAWIEANRHRVRREAHAEFCELFNRPTVTFKAYASLCKRKGWPSGRAWLKPGYVSPIKDRNWTADQLAWIEAHKTLPRRESHAKFCTLFKPDVSYEAYNALCKRKGWKTGRDGRLKPGNVPPNKGKKMPYNANSARTRFKKGQSPHNTKQIGHEWIHPDGYVYIIIDEKNPHTGYKHRSVLKHRHLWEKKHGPVPEGMVLKCLDGNKQNTDPSNWEAVPLAVNALLNSPWAPLRYDEAPDELKPTVMAVAKIRHKAKTAKKKKS